ncbi:DUF6691 family protein [Dyella sp.]|jgi:hypothetical protein|uniref:DUF6691 family protein n=1 Tax=Dyella sp. TaxID=1869338 RepID=UPI002D77564C|nr:DUF6691 family protein [Dyella sp.]HET6434029.1 DUF6691 family protein [Dyella sp.]
MKMTVAMLAGLLFGLGLSLGGMTQPSVVQGFLDLFGAWNPRLVFVMGGAVLTTAIGYRLVFRRGRPLFEPSFQLPTASRFDARLVGGAALFGIGWGIAGYCPGPALASLTAATPALGVLITTMVAGWWLASKIPAARS